MINFRQSEYVRPLPVIQMISLIDILFINLSFFMALSLHFNFESALNISVPTSKTSSESTLTSEDIVVNITKEGYVIVNQKRIALEQLGTILKKAAEVYPSQGVVVRADERTFHQNVVRVLDVCSDARIWNISFATSKEG